MRRPSRTASPAARLTAVALVLGAACAAAPAAGAQSVGDPTQGGRLLAGSAQVELPTGAQLGSVGGPELTQVDHVDVDRYVGHWYQVAAVPQPYSLQCYRDTTADYARTGADSISVHNSCVTPWGAATGIDGTATVRDAATGASLRVNFPQVPFQDENGPVNYRVTYLADDYSMAIVGDPARTSGFVLSRTPALSAEQWTTARRVIGERGWWPCAFVTTPQAGGRADLAPLC